MCIEGKNKVLEFVTKNVLPELMVSINIFVKLDTTASGAILEIS